MSQQQARILVVHAGGTIGMRPTPQGWAPGADLAGWVRQLVAEEFPMVELELASLDPLIDSSNAGPRQWQQVIDAIAQTTQRPDGVVVLHGTDTLAYCAAAVDLSPGLAGLPIVLTGAQRSFLDEDSDAAGNVLGAIRCTLEPRLAGVQLYFDGVALDPRFASKISSSSMHGFDSPNRAPLAHVAAGGGIEFGPRAPRTEPMASRAPYRDCDVVVISLHPGLSASRVAAQLTPVPEAIVLRAYGAGNAPDDDLELLAALANAVAAGAVLVVTTQCSHGGVDLGHYAVSQPLLRLGAVPGGAHSVEGLVALLTHGLSQGLRGDELGREVAARTLAE